MTIINLYSLSYQYNDLLILKLREEACSGKVGVGLDQNSVRQLSAVNQIDQ